MLLNLQNINKGIYFEFYLNDNFFFRYNYDWEVLEIDMFSLCKYISVDLFKNYKYKRFTGTRFECRTVLWFSMLVNQKPLMADIDQSEKVSEAFPLDFNLSVQEFSINFYMNILTLLCNEIDSDSFITELEIWKSHIQRHSPNLLWNSFPNYNSIFQKNLKSLITKKEAEIKSKQTGCEISDSVIEIAISQLNFEIELWQEHSNAVLSCFDIISVQFRKCIRAVKYSNGSYSFKSIQQFLEISTLKNSLYLNYMNGNFKSLSEPQFLDANKMMAVKLFMPKSKNLELALGYHEYLHKQVVLMQNQKNDIVDKLYSLQDQAIDIWKKYKNRN